MLRIAQTSAAARTALAFMTATLCQVGSARAQTTYVGVSTFADIARFGTTGFDESSGGEAFGVALRMGTAITDTWGIDLEFARPGEFDQEQAYDFAVGVPTRTLSILAPSFRFTTTERYSTLTVMPWVRQSLGSRADIVYLGGLAFVRTTTRQSFGDGFRILGIPLGQSWVTYDAAPAVGLDVRVSMTEHVRLVPGLRLLVVDNGGRSGWLIRPSVGLQWVF
jgi:hypothetical protein